MKNFLTALLLTLLCQPVFAEFVTILPVSDRQFEDVALELESLADCYGKTTTIRYWAENAQTPLVVALSNTNINPSNVLTATKDLLAENKLFGMYIGAEAQNKTTRVNTSNVGTVAGSTMTDAGKAESISFLDLTQDYQFQKRSNVALAAMIEERFGVQSSGEEPSNIVKLCSEERPVNDVESSITGDRRTFMDTLLAGMTRSTDYELPMSMENILISGAGATVLGGNGGAGSGSVGFSEGGVGGGANANVPEPTTWAMLLMGTIAIVWYRKSFVKVCCKKL